MSVEQMLTIWTHISFMAAYHNCTWCCWMDSSDYPRARRAE